MPCKSFFPRVSSLLLALILLTGIGVSQDLPQTNQNKFRQLGQELPTPNVYRNAAGAPGHDYWQNRADYDMDIRLDDENQRIYGTETITYHNESPDALEYLWLQLDQNVRALDSDTYKTKTGSISDSENKLSFRELKALHHQFDGGFKIEYVRGTDDQALKHVINRTMLRIDLDQPLASGASYSFKVKWWHNVNDRFKDGGGRSGMEYFKEDDNYLYTIAQFFPRMCVYNEVDGWQNKQFLGRGEFTLPFGDYKVRLTVPTDHVVASTGVLQNPDQVLSTTQLARWEEAQTADSPVLIVTEEEARKAEKTKNMEPKTWEFHAENVRDFAFASSRKFMWDAMAVQSGDNKVMAMSYYPKEGNPLWERYSTQAVAITLKVYSRHTFDYPYPVAISVHTNRIGMEYPMICFNGGRPDADGTYTERTKYGMISVIIHEVGHNYFPMIVNTDERQWTWMDEGLNTFLQYLTEQEWERDYPSRRGPAYKIVEYMKGDKSNISPIMTNSESIHQFGNNAYAKPATSLNILRETILGREAFDHAFRIYSQRWMFKQPSPADMFRTLEDASGTDLDWFWRGWYYTTDHVDLSIDEVNWFQIDTKNPDIEKPFAKTQESNQPAFIGDTRNQTEVEETLTEALPNLNDFYNKYDPYGVSILDRDEYNQYLDSLDQDEKALLSGNHHYYEIKFSNIGGLVMPLILEFTFSDGSKELQRIPAEIWRYHTDKISKVFVMDKEVINITMDPYLETADTDVWNNHWPRQVQPSRFQVFKNNQASPNPMKRARKVQEMEQTGSKGGKKKRSKTKKP
ncbi:MAG: M1 family metallopeptidase [Bacteroidota bacterium]